MIEQFRWISVDSFKDSEEGTALEQFESFFIGNLNLPGRIACQKSTNPRINDLIGMISRPRTKAALESEPCLVIESRDVFRHDILTASWLTPVSESGCPAGSVLFYEDLRFVEAFQFGGVMVIRSSQAREHVIVLYEFFTDCFGMDSEEFLWHTKPDHVVRYDAEHQVPEPAKAKKKCPPCCAMDAVGPCNPGNCIFQEAVT